MKFSTASILATLVCSAVAVDIWLFDNPDACEGHGVGCPGIARRICCRQNDHLFGSVEIEGVHPSGATGRAYTYSNNDYCRVEVGPQKKIPFCYPAGLEYTLSGGVWFAASKREMSATDRDCDGTVEPDEIFKEGDKVYIIKKASLARRSLSIPTEKEHQLEYFKKHADLVVQSDPNVTVSREPVGDASKES
jgi:hypothetical protein